MSDAFFFAVMQPFQNIDVFKLDTIFYIMFRHYLIVAIRNIFRNKVFSLITTTGLSIGMATFVLILLWVMDEMNFDKFHANIDRIYCIIERQDYSDGHMLHTNNTPFALKEELQANYPEVSSVTRSLWMGNRPMSYEEKVITTGPIAFVDPEFFDVFSFKLLSGDPNALKEPNSISNYRRSCPIVFW